MTLNFFCRDRAGFHLLILTLTARRIIIKSEKDMDRFSGEADMKGYYHGKEKKQKCDTLGEYDNGLLC